MVDQLSICNLALARIGARTPLSSLTEQTPEAAYSALFYGQALDATLAANDWRFATAQVPLALVGTPPPQWSYQYALPADCIKIRGLMAAGGWACDPALFERAVGRDALGNQVAALWTRLAAAQINYTARVDNPALWEPGFVTAFSWRLSLDLALPITGNGSIATAMSQGYAAEIAQAATTSANQRARVDDHVPDWIAIRGGGASLDYPLGLPLLTQYPR